MANLGTITRGDTENIAFTVYNPAPPDGNGLPRDVTSDTITFTLNRSLGQSVPDLVKTTASGITKTNPTAGLINVAIAPSDLLALSRSQVLQAEVTVQTSGGIVNSTLHTVNFIIS